MTSAAILSDRLLRANSVTSELERWCQEHGIGDHQIVAIHQPGVSSKALDNDSLDALNDQRAARGATFRPVRLVTGEITVVEALNWYFPTNLTATMREQLSTTNRSFGHVIAQLHPRRRTFFVRHFACGLQVSPRQAAAGCLVAFEHRAIVQAADGSPLAVVHERFLTTLLHRVTASADDRVAHGDGGNCALQKWPLAFRADDRSEATRDRLGSAR